MFRIIVLAVPPITAFLFLAQGIAALIALIFAIRSARKKAPLWVAVMLLSVFDLIRAFQMG